MTGTLPLPKVYATRSWSGCPPRPPNILVGPKPERGISIIGIGCVMFRYVIIIFLSLVLVYAFAAV